LYVTSSYLKNNGNIKDVNCNIGYAANKCQNRENCCNMRLNIIYLRIFFSGQNNTKAIKEMQIAKLSIYYVKNLCYLLFMTVKFKLS